jgi:hypothetical protein
MIGPASSTGSMTYSLMMTQVDPTSFDKTGRTGCSEDSELQKKAVNVVFICHQMPVAVRSLGGE